MFRKLEFFYVKVFEFIIIVGGSKVSRIIILEIILENNYVI